MLLEQRKFGARLEESIRAITIKFRKITRRREEKGGGGRQKGGVRGKGQGVRGKGEGGRGEGGRGRGKCTWLGYLAEELRLGGAEGEKGKGLAHIP
jgi:hypothetical protein